MEGPFIPETGINAIVLDEIYNYTGLLNNHLAKYGNSIPHSSKADYFEQISKDFLDWYNKYPKVRSIECVKDTYASIPHVEEHEEEEEEEEQEEIDYDEIDDDNMFEGKYTVDIPSRQQRQQLYGRKPRTTLDDDEELDSESEIKNQPDDYYQ